MNAYISTLAISGAVIEGVNPLPVFRALNHKRDVRNDGSMLAEELEGFGYETGMRVLPYLVQDRYSRTRRPLVLKTVVLENNILKAVFLPEYGGRLYSLTDLRTGRELLFTNPVFQPANLAIRNAWFSGGIEWNISQLGHTFTTCEPVFFGSLTDEEGNDFLRMYEYERQKKLFWQIDFHLTPGSEFLQAHVKIVNDRDIPTPMYWWTNIAVRESEKTRIFSATAETLFQNEEAVFHYMEENDIPINGASFMKAPNIFGHGSLPYLENSEGPHTDFDVSYPLRYNRSNEYFFQTPKDVLPWEAAAQEDGYVFFERSTQPLRYRKMFCWGAHRGGRKWGDFLASPGEGAYVEIQAGLAPTQVHGMEMPPNSTISFTQIFGGFQAGDPAKCYEDWIKSKEYIESEIESRLSENEVLAIDERLARLAEKPVEKLLALGSGWGALEILRREKERDRLVPESLCFPEAALSSEQAPWLMLLRTGRLPELKENDLPPSWMVDDAWRPLLESAADGAAAMLHLGVMLYENGEYERAKTLWRDCTQILPHPLLYRNLACAYAQDAYAQGGDMEEALLMMEKAHSLEQGRLDKAFAEEYLTMLAEAGRFSEVWRVYKALPDTIRQYERIQILAGRAAIEAGEFDCLKTLFSREFAVVREGETVLTDMWFKLQAIDLANERSVPYDETILEEVRKTMQPPGIIDMRMHARH